MPALRPTSVACGLALGALADALVADPVRGHPVAVFGRWAGTLERLLWRDSRVVGGAHLVVAVAPVAALGVLVPRRTGCVALAAWTVLGGGSLRREAVALSDVLQGGDLAQARIRLPRLCGRDPEQLDEHDVARAVVESVAENTSDAVVAPLLWGALAGVPGLLGYRAVNTLDAMVGHRAPHYARFGSAAARCDDVANWLPARVAALLTAMVAPAAYGGWRRDGSLHPSPNAGQVEAAFAGALGVCLGGPVSYRGQAEQRPVLGAAGRPVEVADIARAVALSRRVSTMATAVAVVLAGLQRR